MYTCVCESLTELSTDTQMTRAASSEMHTKKTDSIHVNNFLGS